MATLRSVFPLRTSSPLLLLPLWSGRAFNPTGRQILTMASAVSAHSQKKVLVPIGRGTEEMEAVIIVDILRRAGADVTMASVETDLQIVASRNVKLVADVPISACQRENFDLVALPGGMPGAERLRDNTILQTIVSEHAEQGRPYGAICAAPAVVLESWGLLKGKNATCHPSFMDKLSKPSPALYRIVKDGLAITSRGPGTAMEFALALVEEIYDKEMAEQIFKALVLKEEGFKGQTVQEFNPCAWSEITAHNKPPLVLVPIANGTEEMEAVIIIDVLRRAGATVVVASVEESLQIVASRKVKLIADQLIQDVAGTTFDLVLLPGGIPGAERLRDSEALIKILRDQAETSRLYGAICASPAVVLQEKNLLKGKKATAYPTFSTKLSDQSAVASRVVIDGLVVTSRGPGTSMEFALSIVEKLYGKEKAASIAEPMVFPYP